MWVGPAGRPYARPGGAEHPEPVSNRINRFWELCGQSRSISGTLGAAPGVFNRRDETRGSRFLLLGFCSLLRCNKRAAFLLRCSRLCLFLRRLLLRRLWRFVAHTLKLPPLVWQTRALNRPTFGIAPLTFGSQPCLTRGSQIGKTKLSVRKAEERHCKEGQERRKEAPQAPALRSISAYGGDEVSHYDQTRKDNSPENSPVS